MDKNKNKKKNPVDEMGGGRVFEAYEIEESKELGHTIGALVSNCITEESTKIFNQYDRNIKQYQRKPMPGDDKLHYRSKYVTSDVQEYVDLAYSQIVRTFDSQKQVVSFQPTTNEPHDIALAKQQTTVVDYVLREKNSHVGILTPWVKNGCLYGLGIQHVSFDEIVEEGRIEVLRGVNDEQLVQLTKDKKDGKLIIVAHSDDYKAELPPEIMQQAVMLAQQQGLSPEQIQAQADANLPDLRDISIRRIKRIPTFSFRTVDVEDFIVSKEADFNPHTGGIEARLQGHRCYVPKADLIDRGYDAQILSEINKASDRGDGVSRERGDKIGDTTSFADFGDEIEVFEIFTHIAIESKKRRHYRITLAGDIRNNPIVLGYEEVSKFYGYAPFVPYPMAGTLFGQGVADRVGPEQELTSRAWRANIDNIHFVSDPIKVINPDVTDPDDALNIFPGKIIRSSDPEAGIRYTSPPIIGQVVTPFIEMLAKRQAAVTGVSAQSLSNGPNDLQDVTATAVLQAKNQQQTMIEQVCRQFADTGYRYVAKIIIDLLVQKPDLAERYLSRLTGKFEALTVDEWDSDMDVTTSITFGMMDREYKNQANFQFLKLQQDLVQTGVASAQNIYVTAMDIAENMGFLNATSRLTDPSTLPPPPPPADPNAGLVQVETLKAQLKDQATEKKMQFEDYKLRTEIDFQRDELVQKGEIERAEIAARYGAQVNVAYIEAEQNKQRTDVDWAIAQQEADTQRKQQQAAAIAAQQAALAQQIQPQQQMQQVPQQPQMPPQL